MKNTITLLFLLSLLCAGCSSSDNPDSQTTFPEENPLALFLQLSGFDADQTTFVDDNNAYEVGFKFVPSVNGNINAVTVRIPKVQSSLRVTIWDSETELPLLTEFVNATQANQFITKDITPLALEQGHVYSITINTHDYYMRHKATWNPTDYPIACGNIEILGVHSEIMPDHLFPYFGVSNGYSGDCSFIFQQTE